MKSKKKLSIHKIIRHGAGVKIHHNRWLIWTAATAIASAIALVGYINISDVSFMDQILNFSNVRSWRTYHAKDMGFRINYPNSWGIEAADANIVFSDPEKSGEDVSVFVYDADAEQAVRLSMNISDEKPIEIDSVQGARITNAITKKVEEQVILLPYNDRLYVIRGFGANFDKIADSFKFNPTP